MAQHLAMEFSSLPVLANDIERGSRPIANAPDVVWAVKRGAWHGFPDFAAGKPVTLAQFRPDNGPSPEFLLEEHPPVARPHLELSPRSGIIGQIIFARRTGASASKAYIAAAGNMIPQVKTPLSQPGFGVFRVDIATRRIEPFFRTRADALGPRGFEHVATAGPKRPIDMKISRRGDAMYVADLGAVAEISTSIGAMPRPYPGTGVVWRIVPDQARWSFDTCNGGILP